MTRKCISCNIQKLLTDFPKATTPSYSQQRYINKCKFCTNLYAHDISYSDYVALVKVQNNKCSLCERSLDEVKIHIDHDHNTGKVRGVLCRGCNISLGTLEKSSSLEEDLKVIEIQRTRIIKASEYLTNPPFKKVKSLYE